MTFVKLKGFNFHGLRELLSARLAILTFRLSDQSQTALLISALKGLEDFSFP